MKARFTSLFIFITIVVFAQHSYIPSERIYTTKNGLSSDKVLAIHKDSKGFMWIGTENGLDRFDGNSFVNFSKSNSKMTLGRVQFIAEDSEGYLWIVEKNKPFEHYFMKPQIIFYNVQNQTFVTFKERFGKVDFDVSKMNFIKQMEDGSIFFILHETGKGFLYKNGQFKKYTFSEKFTRFSDAVIKKDGSLLLECVESFHDLDRFIFQLNTNGKILQKIRAKAPITFQSETGKHQFQLQAKDHLVGGTNLAAYQLFYPNLKTTTVSNAQHIDQSVWNKNQKLLWLKSHSNIYAVQKNGNIVYQKIVGQDQFTMPIIFDGYTTWYSDKQNGLVALTLTPNHFQTYQQFSQGFSNSARGIYADTKGNIWISTVKGVLYKKANQSNFTFNRTNYFTSFLKDNANQLWSLKELNLVKTNLSNGSEQLIPHDYNGSINYWSIYQAADGKFWFYGNHGYFLTYNPTTNEFNGKLDFLPIDNGAFNVYHIEERDEQSVWLCTTEGLYAVDNNGKFITRYNSNQKGKYYLPTMDIHHLYKDKSGAIWLATGDNGLIQLKMENEKLLSNSEIPTYSGKVENHYTTDNGLSCNILHSVYEDDYEYLWLSSNEGLMQFDKRTQQVVTYTTENGLLHNEFNRISHFRAEDGTLYFGGLTGVISFHPKHFSHVRHNGNNIPLAVTDFQQFSGKKGKFENLTSNLLKTETICLKPNDRFFKLNLALLNYQDGTTYKYRIKDLYDWQDLKNSELIISGLPYGNHTLEIKAYDNNQQEAANTLVFPIRVLRPFYLQWWFILLSIVAIGCAVFFFIKSRTEQLMVLRETEQLRQLDKMKSQFFANISHELRTPITLILAPLSQFLKKDYLSENDRKDLSNIYANGKSLLSLVNEVLDLSKLASNKLTLNLSPTQIPDFIARVVANFESAAKVKNIEYQFMSFLDKTLVAQFDKAKLEKILNNLLSNALKFTPKNGVIQVMVGAMNGELTIKIKDSGKGIEAEDLPHIFERYFQSKNKEMAGGTGIGLALTKELTELMNGTISVQSEFGNGTEFTVKLPINLIENGELKIENEVNPTSNEKKSETTNLTGFQNLSGLTTENLNDKKETILLVEDNLSLQQFIHSVLSPFYNVKIANNGVEALQWLEKPSSEATVGTSRKFRDNRLPSAVISDVMMPEMDGFTLLEKVKADDRFCSIPFVLLTARADIKDKLRGLRIGVDDYMTKPFEVEELLLRIKNLINNSKNRLVADVEEEVEIENNSKKVETSLKSTNDSQIDSDETNHQSPITNHQLAWLEQVETIVKREVNNKQFKLSDVAQELLMSQKNMARKVKQITGLSPNKYIRTVRLQMAREILETQEVYTLKEVSITVGFENVTYFGKLFEEEFGKHPNTYLEKRLV